PIYAEGAEREACFFFFSSRRRHTRSKRDWSSDVCSSDLARHAMGRSQPALPGGALQPGAARADQRGIAARRGDRNARAEGTQQRSEERRVGKECRARRSQGGVMKIEELSRRRMYRHVTRD